MISKLTNEKYILILINDPQEMKGSGHGTGKTRNLGAALKQFTDLFISSL